jgi:hypothetical protein
LGRSEVFPSFAVDRDFVCGEQDEHLFIPPQAPGSEVFMGYFEG